MYVCILIILYLFTCYCLICGLLCILYIVYSVHNYDLLSANESGTCKLMNRVVLQTGFGQFSGQSTTKTDDQRFGQIVGLSKIAISLSIHY